VHVHAAEGITQTHELLGSAVRIADGERRVIRVFRQQRPQDL
jgi:hypothetical protein